MKTLILITALAWALRHAAAEDLTTATGATYQDITLEAAGDVWFIFVCEGHRKLVSTSDVPEIVLARHGIKRKADPLARRDVGKRLGETLEQSIARYGQPTKLDKVTGEAFFEKSGYAIDVLFYNGKSEMVRYTKTGMGLGEANALMVLNCDGWRCLDASPDEWSYSSPAGDFFARYSMPTGTVWVMSKASTEHPKLGPQPDKEKSPEDEAAAKAAAVAAKVKGSGL